MEALKISALSQFQLDLEATAIKATLVRVRKNILSACPRQVKIVQDKQSQGDGYPTDKFISQLLYDPQKSMTYQTTLEFHEKAFSGLLLGI